MSITGQGEIASKASAGKPEGGFLGLVRVVALIALLFGAGGSFLLFLRAGQRTPRVLLVIMAIWVFSPFMALVWANLVSKHWSVLTRSTLYAVTLILSLGSLAIYTNNALRPPEAQAAFVYVLVPPVSWLLITIVMPIAAFVSRKPSRRSNGAEILMDDSPMKRPSVSRRRARWILK